MRKIITNTSCLIALSNINQLELLHQVYGIVCATPEVEAEFGEKLPDWIEVVPVADPAKTKLIANMLDLGESSTIALAMEDEESTMILDDGKARKFAKSIGLKFTGTLGVVMKAKQLGVHVDIHAVIQDLRDCGFRIPRDIEDFLFEE